jgi:ABC-2 type transport system ATP-binding protein
MIQVTELTKRYGDLAALDRLSFEIATGQIVALLGPNGAGKTTTLEILEGYLAPSAGTVCVLGVDPRRGDRTWRARLGLVAQSTSLDLLLTVREALSLFARAYPSPRPLAEVLGLVDLKGQADTRIGQLSGGQQRRVDLAVGIIGRPELLFLDEPTTGLDPAARQRIWAIIQELADGGTTVVLSTHFMEEAERLADRLLVVASGRLVADAAPADLRATSATTLVRLPLRDPRAADSLPASLAGHADRERRELAICTTDPLGTLEAIATWARACDVDIAGIEVGRPSLEQAYLALTTLSPRLDRKVALRA